MARRTPRTKPTPKTLTLEEANSKLSALCTRQVRQVRQTLALMSYAEATSNSVEHLEMKQDLQAFLTKYENR